MFLASTFMDTLVANSGHLLCPRPTLTFDLEVGVGVTCDLGYPCAKFRLPRPFGFRVRADVRDIRRKDRRTDG